MASSVLKKKFSKKERLTKRSDIMSVFAEGRSFVIFPFKFIFLESEKPQWSVLFTVPKRSFKKAVDRNAIRRQLKEIYRLHKDNLNRDFSFNLAVIYLAKEKLPFNSLKNKLILGLTRLMNKDF